MAPLSAGDTFDAAVCVPPCPLCLCGAKLERTHTGHEKNADLSETIVIEFYR